jgi:hypothetical protein
MRPDSRPISSCSRNSPGRSLFLSDELKRPMSAIGTKRTYRVAPHMSAFGGIFSIVEGSVFMLVPCPDWGVGGAMRRRDLLFAIGGVAAGWPLGAKAQQAAKLPTIGFLGPLWLRGPPPSCNGCATSDGSTAAPSRSSTAGQTAKANAWPILLPSSCAKRSPLLSPEELRQLLRQSRRHRSYRLSSALQGILFASA